MITDSIQVPVGGHIYLIKFLPTSAVDDAGHPGICDAETNSVKISYKTSSGDIKPTSEIERLIWHELLHAIAKVFSVSLRENATNAFAEGIVQILGHFGFQINRIQEDV